MCQTSTASEEPNFEQHAWSRADARVVRSRQKLYIFQDYLLNQLQANQSEGMERDKHYAPAVERCMYPWRKGGLL